MIRLFCLMAMICCVGLVGCDFPEQKRPMSSPGGIDIGTNIDTGGATPVAQNPDAPTTTETTPPPPPEGRKTADVGDGKKGHYSERLGRVSIFDRTIGTMYRMQEKMDYQMVKHAMDLYQATNGHYPKTHEEFMKEIIEYNKIKLPELRDDCRYEYNPEKAELEVVYPLDAINNYNY